MPVWGRRSLTGLEVGVLGGVLLLAIGGTLLATARYGVGLTPDSVLYLDGAHSLADGLGHARNGVAITIFPPGYPAVLSLGDQLGFSAMGMARAVGVVSFALTTVLGFVLLHRHVRSPRVVAAGTIVIGCSAILLAVFKQALSDQLFIVVVLLLVLAAEGLVARPRSLWLLAGATVLVWAGFYLRYAGVVLVPYTVAVLVVTSWPNGKLRALGRAAAFVVAAFSVPALWMMRNVDVGSGLMGGRHQASATPLTNVRRTALMLSGWVSFDGPTAFRAVAFVLGLAVIAVIVVLVLPVRSKLVARSRELWPLALFVGLYIVYLIATASVVAFAPIHNRYLIPVYVPIVVLGAWTFERLRARLGPTGQLAITAIAVTWIAANVLWFGAHALRAERDGAGGYATQGWHESPLMEDVRAWDPATSLVTNDTNAIELFAGRIVPEGVAKTWSGSSQGTDDLARFVEQVRCEGEVGLVWFTESGTRGRLYKPKELAQHVTLVPKVTRADGTIYEVTPLPGTGAGGDCDRGSDAAAVQ